MIEMLNSAHFSLSDSNVHSNRNVDPQQPWKENVVIPVFNN